MKTAALICVGALSLSNAAASDLIYRPVNPAFGGRPLNGSFLLGTAQSQNDFKSPDQRRDESSSERFARALESRLLGGLANQVSEAIFGDNAQQNGTIVFGEQQISFERGLDAISVEILDANTGTSTLIEVPTLQID